MKDMSIVREVSAVEISSIREPEWLPDVSENMAPVDLMAILNDHINTTYRNLVTSDRYTGILWFINDTTKEKISVLGPYGKAFLDSFTSSQDWRQNRCSTCIKFLNRYSGLVHISADGMVESALWDIADIEKYDFITRNIISGQHDLAIAGNNPKAFDPTMLDRLVLGDRDDPEFTHLSLELVAENNQSKITRAIDSYNNVISFMCTKECNVRLIEDTINYMNLRGDDAIRIREIALPVYSRYLDILSLIRENRSNISIIATVLKYDLCPDAWKLKDTTAADILAIYLSGDYDGAVRLGNVRYDPNTRMIPTKDVAGSVAMDAVNMLIENDYEQSFNRRLALPSDIPEEYLLFNRPISKSTDSPLKSYMVDKAAVSDKKPSKGNTRMTIDAFVSTVLPKAKRIWYIGTDTYMSPTYHSVPVDPDSKPILRTIKQFASWVKNVEVPDISVPVLVKGTEIFVCTPSPYIWDDRFKSNMAGVVEYHFGIRPDKLINAISVENHDHTFIPASLVSHELYEVKNTIHEIGLSVKPSVLNKDEVLYYIPVSDKSVISLEVEFDDFTMIYDIAPPGMRL